MSTADASPEQLQRRRQIAATCWKKGTEAMSKDNWDYAIEMFGQCAQLVPDNVVYRQTVRNCEYKKYKGNGTGAAMAGMRLMGVRGKIKKARNAKNWTEMDLAAEEGLTVNPWDGQLNADLGEAALQLEHTEVAVYAYELAVKSDPKNKDFWRGLAEARAQKHDYTGAGSCWRKIYELDPMDGHARSMIQASDSQATIHKSRMDEAKTASEVRQGYEASVKGNVNTGPVGPGDSPEADLQRAIRKEPANKDNYFKLADLYHKTGKLQLGMETYQKAFEVSGDQNAREMAENLELELLKENADLAKQKFAANPQDEHLKQGSVELAKELLQREIEVYAARTERYPKDLKLKYELAQRYMRVANFPAATKLLQQATADTRIEGQVLLLLGKCFLQQKQNSLAQRQFEKALGKFSSANQPAEFIECHYILGRIAEEAKNPEAAEQHYSEVIGVDYEYKDARTRLEKIQAERGHSGLSDLGEI